MTRFLDNPDVLLYIMAVMTVLAWTLVALLITGAI